MKRNSLFTYGLFVVSTIFAGTIYPQQTPSPAPTREDSPIPSSPARSSITAAFWNIQWFPGGRPNARPAEESRQIASVHRDIAELNPDLLGMEEVRGFEYAAVAVQPLRDFKVDVCSNFPPREDQERPQQVAIASRLQPISAWAEAWKPGSSVTPPRGFAFAAYPITPKRILLVYAVHLKSNRGGLRESMAIREESIQQLRAHMRAMTDAYSKLGGLSWIVGGDFNTAPDEPRFASEKTSRELFANGLRWNWRNVPFSDRITLPADNRYPAACFDHIFYRGANLRRTWLANTSSGSSDHRAVTATLDLDP